VCGCVGSLFFGKKIYGCVANGLEFSGYLSDEGSPRRAGQADMSVFRNAVQDCLDYEPKPVQKPGRLKGSKASNDAEVDKFSGLRIRSVILFLSKVKKDVKHLNYI
jgi:minichromosome maintenance protein 10